MDNQRFLPQSKILEQLLKTTHEGFWFIDNETMTVDVNPAMCELLGLPYEEIIGCSIFDFVDEDNAEIFRRQISNRHKGQRGGYEISLRRPDGTNVPCLNNASAIYDDEGRKVASIGLWTDISEIKQTQEALRKAHSHLEIRVEERTAELAKATDGLRQSEAQMRLVTDNIPVLVAYIDRDLIIRFANRPYGEFYGVSHHGIIGMHVRDFVGTERLELGLPYAAKALAGEVTSNEGEWLPPNREKRYLRTTRVPHFEDNGEVQGYFIIHIDLTEHHAREEQLHQAQKLEAVGQLTGGIAHDFNNLLTVVIGNLELAQEHFARGKDVTPLLERAQKGAMRGATLTHRLLAFSRKQALEPQNIDTQDLVRGMSDLFSRTLEESIEIEFMEDDELWRCKVDPSQLENALLNLAINARDAMDGVGKLTIETKNINLDDVYSATQAEVTPGQYVMVAVSDTGSGMPKNVIDHVFDPFFTTKEVGKGSGLGLSMVYGFVKQSGGNVTIYSEENFGTTVKMYLPRSGSEAEQLHHREKAVVPKARGETILVVEDDPDVRTLSVALLSSLGYEVIVAADGPQALSMLEKSPRINLLFTDVVLPGGMNGPELAAEVARRQPGVRILYTSGYTEDAIIHQGWLNGGTELLHKPFSRADLERKVRASIDSFYS
jgi:PAS domain S-box-containing protein